MSRQSELVQQAQRIGEGFFDIDASGRVTMPYQPAFLASNPPNPVTVGTVVFSTTGFNVGGHYSTSTGRFTAPLTGTYFFESHIRRELNEATIAWHRPELRVNGTQIAETLGNLQGHTSGSFSSTAFAVVVRMTAGDYAEVIYSSSGNASSSTTANECGFCGYLIG